MRRYSLIFAVFLVGLAAGIFLVGSFTQGQSGTPANVPRELTSYRDIVKKVLPAVVSIEIKAKGQAGKTLDETPLPEKFFNLPRQSFGSGFFIDGKGALLTNFHVVEAADQVTVQLPDGRKFTSSDIRTDRRTDLALIRLDIKGGVPFLELGDSETMEIGDRVLAVGAPFGLVGSVTHGIISGKGRNLNLNMYEDFLQTDAAINPGNSGGPLVNLEGKVVGINSAIKTRSGGFQGVGLAVASNLAKFVAKSLLSEGVVRRGYLGIQIRDWNNGPDTGAVVTEVYEKTPAAKAGIRVGDVITAIAGKAVKDAKGLQAIVANMPTQQPASIALLRDGKTLKMPVTIEEQPDQFGN